LGTVLTVFGLGLNAGTIVIAQGNTPGTYSQTLRGPTAFTTYVEVGWTTGAAAYSNVSIQATLQGLDPGGDSVMAYLTTSFGPGTTTGLSNDSPVPYNTYSSVTLFSGLSLLANTSYYLTIAPDGSDEVLWGIDNSQPAPIADTGVSILAANFCTEDIPNCAPYPPASGFPGNPLGVNPIFSVTVNSGVPEPMSGLLLAGGLALLGAVRRLRA